jgi:CHAD domain-containing protein
MRRLASPDLKERARDGEGSRLAWQALAAQQARLRSTVARLRAARPGDVHDARVAARRLRSLLATWRPLFDQRESERLRRRLRDLARVLCGPREADVRRSLLQTVAGRIPALTDADVQRIRAALQLDRAESRRALRRALDRDYLTESVRVLGDERTLAALRLRDDVDLVELLEHVDRPWREMDRLLARRPGTAAELHRLRLALKRCRYALESVSSLRPGRARRALDRLRSAQDSLGQHHDTVTVRKWLKTNQETLGRPLVRRLDRELRSLQKALKAEAIRRVSDLAPAYAQWRTALLGLRSLREAKPAAT